MAPPRAPLPFATPRPAPSRLRPALVALLLAAGVAAASAQPQAPSDLVDIGTAVPDAATVQQGLFPQEEADCDALRRLQGEQFKCMGFRPAVRFSLPATSFRLGSAELPEGLKKQLEVFAEVLRGKKGSGKVVKIEGHADRSGSSAGNLALSERRAEAVRSFLVERGADPAMLATVGRGDEIPKNPQDPFAAENRRVEIGRAQPPTR